MAMHPPIRIGLQLDTGDPREVVRRAILAEKIGFDSVLIPDHIVYPPSSSSVYDCWSLLSVIGYTTSKITFAPLVSDSFRRHPALVAQTLCTLNAISGGRAFMMIGAGEPMQLLPLGIRLEKPVSHLAEYIEVLRLLLGSSPNNPVNFEGRFFGLRKAFVQVKSRGDRRVPIYVAAVGKNAKKLAAAKGDGFVNLIDTPTEYKQTVAELRRLLSEQGRKIREFDFAFFGRLALADRMEDAEGMLRHHRSSFVWHSKRSSIEESNKRSRNYLDNFTMDNEDDFDIRASRVSLERAKRLSCWGDVKSCVGKAEKYIKAGAQFLIFESFDDDFVRFSRLAAEFTRRIRLMRVY